MRGWRSSIGSYMKKKYRVITDGKHFCVQYSYFGMFWKLCVEENKKGLEHYKRFDKKTDAFDYIEEKRLQDAGWGKWIVVK